MLDKKTMVLGASLNSTRYSFLAINKLRQHGHTVVAVGLKEGYVGDVPITKNKVEEKNIDTVTLYMNPTNQKAYYDYIFSLKPKRIIFNPGTENIELEEMATAKGIETIEACTLVLLSIGKY